MSELELSLFRQRSQEALKYKARRGALFLGVAAGACGFESVIKRVFSCPLPSGTRFTRCTPAGESPKAKSILRGHGARQEDEGSTRMII